MSIKETISQATLARKMADTQTGSNKERSLKRAKDLEQNARVRKVALNLVI